jgi:hypothetical protein
MATSPTAAVGSPPVQGRRRASTRRSSGALPPALDSPRTAMPRDDNAFSFRQKHLDDWLMPESVWVTLPEQLKLKVMNMQRSGAAVCTSLERLDELGDEIPVINEDDETDSDEPIGSMADKASQDFINARLAEVQAQRRASETAPARKEEKEKFDCSPIPPEYRSFGSILENGDTAFSSNLNTPHTNVTSCPSPLHLSQSPELMSPAPLDIGQTSRRSSNAMEGPPRDAQTGHYLAQLDQLRKQDIVRLRHSVRAVETELSFLSKSFSPTSSPESTAVDNAQPAESNIDVAFQVWWPEKKELALSLEKKCRFIEPGLKYNLGWSDAIPYEG